MSKVKINSDLFLGDIELNKVIDFIKKYGFDEFINNKSVKYGIVKNRKLDPNFNYFKLQQSGTVSGNITFTLQGGYAVCKDSDLNIRVLKNSNQNQIPFPQDGNWYWIFIQPAYKKIENGTLSVDNSGNLIGNGTEFTKILRGQPDFPSKVKLYKLDADNINYSPSSLNQVELTINSVVDDTHATVTTQTVSETNLYYSSVGTFTPGVVVNSNDKEIFQYDDCLISIVQETSVGVKPSYTQDQQFAIYRVKYESGNLVIQDFRTEIFCEENNSLFETISDKVNPLIGIEKISYQDSDSSLENNDIYLSWGLRSSNYTINSNLNKVSITSGNGGVYKTTSQFVNGDFDGWKLYINDLQKNTVNEDSYSNNERCFKVLSSVKNGSGIDLIIESMTITDFVPTLYSNTTNYNQNDKVSDGSNYYKLVDISSVGKNVTQTSWSNSTTYASGGLVTYNSDVYQSLVNGNLNVLPTSDVTKWKKVWAKYTPEIFIAPDCESVEIKIGLGSDSTLSSLNSDKILFIETFNVNTPLAKISVLAKNDDSLTDFVYNAKYRYIVGKKNTPYLKFPSDSIGYVNEEGVTTPIDSNYYYANFKVLKNSYSISKFRDKVDTGEKYGVDNVFIDSSYVYKNLKVGVDRQYQIFSGSLYTLSSDVVINVSKLLQDNTTPIKDGARWFLIMKQPLNVNGNEIIFKQDAETSPGTGGTIIHTVTPTEIMAMNDTNGVLYSFVYSKDTGNWNCYVSYISPNDDSVFSIVYVDYKLDAVSASVQASSYATGYTDYTVNTGLIRNQYNVTPLLRKLTYNSAKNNAAYSNVLHLSSGSNIEMKIDLPNDGVKRLYDINAACSVLSSISGTSSGLRNTAVNMFYSCEKTNLSDNDTLDIGGTSRTLTSTTNDGGGSFYYTLENNLKGFLIHDGLSQKSIRIHLDISSEGAAGYGFEKIENLSLNIVGKHIK